MNKSYLYPGQIIIAQGEYTIKTLLGSCIAVAMFDPKLSMGGMIHFLLPEPMSEEEHESLRYAVYAIPELIHELVSMGASRQRLQAKVFGGARVLGGVSENLDVGSHNIKVARQLLREYQIPIVEEKVGGDVGCTISMELPAFRIEHKYMERKNRSFLKVSGQ